MPLGKKGQSLLADFVQRYGKTKGTRIFYSKENSDPKFAKVVKK